MTVPLSVARSRSPSRYCSHCGARLIRRRVEGRTRSVCPRCGRVDYENAKPCAGALVVRGGEVLLVRRAVLPYRGWWDIPGGFLEAEEHPEHGAVREVREETGLRVRLGGLFGVYLDRHESDPTLNLYYLARPIGGRERPADDAAALGWFGPGDLPERIAYPGHARRVLADWERRRLARTAAG